jgi:hypothetical protein
MNIKVAIEVDRLFKETAKAEGNGLTHNPITGSGSG